ncbi:MAG: dihydropteroate synthase [Holosporales bacterium]|jgi:2-amino-4-hydroxy-6-hydroxymethyldihydropteridine diphosphokinase/dihydropteroate synthase|nr:dihydropteroate synthase [Holosporales bacterium]
MIYLSLGSNIGDRLAYLRQAVAELVDFFTVCKSSVVFETKAVLPIDAPASWDHSYYNMVVAGESLCSPEALLYRLQEVECRIGRPKEHILGSPRVIDLDILLYHNVKIDSDALTIPHKELKNRSFFQSLLAMMGAGPDNAMVETYTPLRSFVLEPKIVGIVNVTPDSFSDGGCFFAPESAVKQVQDVYTAGATIVEFGAQSTHPGYTEIPPQEEIARLAPVVEMCQGIGCLGIDTYFDEVVDYALKNSFLWINDIKARLQKQTIKKIADHGAKLVTMLYGMDIKWLEGRIQYLINLGLCRENIILDPGVGFGKTKQENIAIIQKLSQLQELGCPVMLAHARKSFMARFSSHSAAERDIETLAVSQFAACLGIDYLRVHNVQEHMRFFVAGHCVAF